MSIKEAKRKLQKVIKEIQEEGIEVWDLQHFDNIKQYRDVKIVSEKVQISNSYIVVATARIIYH